METQNQMIIILDKHKKPLGFVSEKRCKELLKSKKAVVHKIMPFIIRHKTKEAKDCVEMEFKIKIDPGSKYTGIAITDLDNNVYFKAVIEHRGQIVVSNLKTKHDNRRNRRNRGIR